MRSLKNTILRVSIVLSLIYFVYALTSSLSALDPQTRVAVIAAFGTLIVAIVTNFIQKKKDLDFKMREQKLPTYDRILEMYRSTFLSTKQGGKFDVDEMVRKQYEINHALLLAGSNKVIVAWSNLYKWITDQAESENGNEQVVLKTLVIRSLLSELVKAIREDLGHKDPTLSDDEIADLMLPLQPDFKRMIEESISKEEIKQLLATHVKKAA